MRQRLYDFLALLLRACLRWLLRCLLWFAVLVAAWWSAGAVLQYPASAPTAADAVVILGGGGVDRYRLGKEIVKAGFAPKLIFTEPIPAYLLRDISNSSLSYEVITDRVSRSSWDEAVNTRRWMEENGVRHVLVVSDPPHMLRLAYTWWRSALHPGCNQPAMVVSLALVG